ncbi:MAG: Asp-tRNA(Asn)/Glu-tRNA(Gln) amidotransferase subunit GatC [Pyrodictiaceae archaeon]
MQAKSRNNESLIEHLARLARLELSEEEKKRISRGIEAMRRFIDTILDADVDYIEPLYHPLESKGFYRRDEPRPGLSREDALLNVSESEKGFVKAPRTIED